MGFEFWAECRKRWRVTGVWWEGVPESWSNDRKGPFTQRCSDICDMISRADLSEVFKIDTERFWECGSKKIFLGGCHWLEGIKRGHNFNVGKFKFSLQTGFARSGTSWVIHVSQLTAWKTGKSTYKRETYYWKFSLDFIAVFVHFHLHISRIF